MYRGAQNDYIFGSKHDCPRIPAHSPEPPRIPEGDNNIVLVVLTLMCFCVIINLKKVVRIYGK